MTDAVHATEPHDAHKLAEAKKATAAAAFGTFLEYYDFSVYGYCAARMSAEFFPSDNPTVSLLSTLAVFGLAFIGPSSRRVVLRAHRRPVRPQGFAPRHCYPDRPCLYRHRLFAGLLGNRHHGAYPADPLPHPARFFRRRGNRQRGFLHQGMGPAVQTGPVPFLRAERRQLRQGGSSRTRRLTAYLFAGEQASWAWRVPFLMALPLMLGCLYLRLKIEDTPDFKQMKASGKLSKAPVRELLSAYPASLAKLFMFSLVQNVGTYCGTVYVAIYLRTVLKMPAAEVGFIVLIAVTWCGPVHSRLRDHDRPHRRDQDPRGLLCLLYRPELSLLCADGPARSP